MLNIPITQLIPPRAPIVMVDTLWEYSPTTAVVGLTVLEDNIFVHEGSFSASGLIEHMAQSTALHKGYGYYLNHQPAPMGYIGAIKHIEIHKLPPVGAHIKTSITIVQEFMDVTLVSMETYLEDVCIAQGEMKTVLAK